jgi:GAF domain-containing protein
VRSDDITKDSRYGLSAPHHGMPEGHVPVRSYLAVPVVSRSGDSIGGLFYGHGEAGRFDARHERLLVGIAGQAATAIDNARLFEAAQREIARRQKVEERREFLLQLGRPVARRQNRGRREIGGGGIARALPGCGARRLRRSR